MEIRSTYLSKSYFKDRRDFPVKRYRVTEWILKRNKNLDLVICCLQETHFYFKRTHRLKVTGWKL